MKLLIILLFTVQSLFAFDGVKLGSETPIDKLNTTSNKEISLKKHSKPLVLVFFRGSWCPYCITQLKEINKTLIPKIQGKADLLAISVDKLKKTKMLKDKQSLNFDLVSDPKAKTLVAFNIINKLESDLVKKYKNSYGIDIEGDSGETHHMIAHPAVFIIKNGKVVFADVHTDYKQRTANADILKALGI